MEGGSPNPFPLFASMSKPCSPSRVCAACLAATLDFQRAMIGAFCRRLTPASAQEEIELISSLSSAATKSDIPSSDAAAGQFPRPRRL